MYVCFLLFATTSWWTIFLNLVCISVCRVSNSTVWYAVTKDYYFAKQMNFKAAVEGLKSSREGDNELKFAE